MSKKDKVFKILDDMVIALNEQKRQLGTRVKTGQLTNVERHQQLNQLYLLTLHSTVDNILKLNPTPNTLKGLVSNMETIVTPDQYKQGYLVLLGGYKPYALIKKLPNGNYLVKTPSKDKQSKDIKVDL